eukprot:1530836-Alexandrium_andersonii.AAC.1
MSRSAAHASNKVSRAKYMRAAMCCEHSSTRATVCCELPQSKQPCVANNITMHTRATTRDRHYYTHV